ncbi:MAG: hypothetical protein A2W04_00210 [Betaproteobacteria bacterium RBG_16_64_9]|nr:MAG: hypothetical protein A2W04_00210 [Betaproteobacteria bacterium RBG_16_64_9]OGA24028.1 MAG: hypothetical protein A3I01_16970 [Betaproteobacteria bacterium RIFCSPLOWO2_02_FULL_65_24]OGA96111.1 MAG: hypothetical protein A3G27_09815 [Betaproteobacteria bacterium RIFCSPLOWO2_12_FULL_66_14]
MKSSVKGLFYIAAVACAAAPYAVLPQAYPARSITVLSGASIGSGGDVAMRVVAAKMSEALGQPMVVEARRGAGGLEAYTAGARAEPNGYTITFVNSGLVTNRFMKKDMPVDALKDYAPISVLFSTAFFLAAHPSLPANNLKELLSYAKRNPGKVTFASTGIGSAAHLVGESLNSVAGTRMLHVPYAGKNTALAVNDLVGGRVDMYLASLSSLAQHAAAGKVKLIALVDSVRHRQQPHVATVNELLPGYYNIVVWWGFLGPVGLPRPIVDRLRGEALKVISDPAMAAKFDSVGVATVTHGGPEEFARIIRSDVENIGKVVNALGLKPE